jgi:GDPmannose 4,6-dehydratase
MKRTALITGINGQDGSYLAEFLLEKGYEVWGTIRRNSSPEYNTTRVDHIFNRVNLVYADLTDMSSLVSVLQKAKPDEIYNLAAQSHVRVSFDAPIYTAEATGLGTLNLLEAIRLTCPKVRFYQASSSEMFGNTIDDDGFQRETTQLNPVSPYGCAKVFSYNICNNYKNSYGMHISNGILFNHESPRRGMNFVTNKVVNGAVDIKQGRKKTLTLGNLSASRDWGHAKDYVKAMWMMLQQDEPDNYVCSTGVSHTVQDLVDYTFGVLGVDTKLVKTAQQFERPEELQHLKGDCTKLKTKLGWEPTYTFESMLDEMIFVAANKRNKDVDTQKI